MSYFYEMTVPNSFYSHITLSDTKKNEWLSVGALIKEGYLSM